MVLTKMWELCNIGWNLKEIVTNHIYKRCKKVEFRFKNKRWDNNLHINKVYNEKFKKFLYYHWVEQYVTPYSKIRNSKKVDSNKL
jgi:hypothetical protein